MEAAPTEQKQQKQQPEDGQKKENTTSNLPLLFANGYPTSLEKITEAQLAKFIPFMVQCSLGNVQHNQGISSADDNEATVSQTIPTWWPEDIPFVLPLVQPVNINQDDWTRKLKELVCMCYEHHNNVFLLRFCTVLSKYEPECLRFINNYNSTTSLYDRFNNKLLVTFRNENMLYDRQHNPNRICLLPHRKTGAADSAPDLEDAESSLGRPSMVEPPLFDIYLCDYCDAELYSHEAYREHEKSCREASEQCGDDDSDVILCEDVDTSPTAPATIASSVKRRNRKRVEERAEEERERKQKKRKKQLQELFVTNSDDAEEDSNDVTCIEESATGSGDSRADDKMRLFMSHFQLVSAKGVPANNWPQRSPRKNGMRSPVKLVNADKAKRRRNADRNVLTVQRCATVPLSSPMGKFLLNSQKTILSRDYTQERVDRMERFCPAPVIRDGVRPRWLNCIMGGGSETFPVTFRPIDYRGMFEKSEGYDSKYVHMWRVPRRQLSQRSRELCWAALTRILLKACRPFSVDVVRLTDSDIRMYFLHMAIERKKRELLELRRTDLKRLLVQQHLSQEAQQRKELKRAAPDECIDLCSSDEEGENGKGKGGGGGAKRQRMIDEGSGGGGGGEVVVPSEEDEMKENREEGSKEAMITETNATTTTRKQLVKILPKPIDASVQSGGQQQQLVQSRNGGFLGEQTNQLNTATAVPRSHSAIHSESPQVIQVKPQQFVRTWTTTPVLVANGPSGGVLVATTTSTTTVPSFQGLVAPVVTRQPSSYLFLTKQQLVYQKLEVASTMAAAQVVQGKEVEKTVEQTGMKVNNSSLGGQGDVVGQSKGEVGTCPPPPNTHPSNIIINVSKSNNVRKTLPTRNSVTSTATVDFSNASSSSSSGSGPRLRRTSACETSSSSSSFAMPKKMPPLIRIAPTVSGE